MKTLLPFLLLAPLYLFSQTEGQEIAQSTSNIQTYTPTKLLRKGQWDIKWFNNLYTETKRIDRQQNKTTVPRQNFFTSSLDIFSGVSDSNRLNLGLLLEYRSNTINGKGILAPFAFEGGSSNRSGLTSIAPAIKFTPIKKWERFAIQSSISFPLFSEAETVNGIFLDQKGKTFQNRFFYDYLAPNGTVQIYAEVNTQYNFGKKENSFANDSFGVSPGLFLSYFPSANTTFLLLAQHYNLIAINNGFSQNYSALGGGAKFQLNKTLNLELLYSNFVRGKDNGLGQTFNIGLRALLD